MVVYYKEQDSLLTHQKAKQNCLGGNWGKEELLSMAFVNRKYLEDRVLKFWKNR